MTIEEQVKELHHKSHLLVAAMTKRDMTEVRRLANEINEDAQRLSYAVSRVKEKQ
jgi:hypothetical protein